MAFTRPRRRQGRGGPADAPRTAARRARRRGRAALAALALALSQLLGVLGAAVQVPAGAEDLGTMTVTGVTDIQDWPDITAPFRNFHSFTVSGGATSDGVGWCAAKTLSTPAAGATFSGGQKLGDARVDYVLYHGYSSTATEGYGLTPGKFYVATQYALWLVLPDVGGSHAEVEDELTRTYADVARVVRQMVGEADAYAARGGGGPEAGCAVYWPSPDGAVQAMLTRTNPTGAISLQKASSSPEVTDGNALYSLAGAVYGVYSDEGCQSQVATMTTGADGSASADGLAAGTYYVREVTPSPGFSLDPTVYTASVGGGATTHLSVTETPQGDVGMAVQKVDAATGTASAQGDATLAGAEFTVRYYAGAYATVDELPEAATRSWVLRTDETGRTSLALAQDDPETYLVSGDELYLASDGRAAVPLGTLTVQETRAPQGYQLPGDAMSLTLVTGSGTGELVTALAPSSQADSVIAGGVSVRKADRELLSQEGYGGAERSSLPLGAATLAGARFEVANASERAVVVDGVTFEPGEVVRTLVTGEDGTASTAADALPFGTYVVTEACAPDGYLLDEGWSRTFEVREQGVVVDLSTDADAAANQVVRGDLSLVKAEEGTQGRMAGVPFRLTSQTTGEWHVVVTDENGMLDTASSWGSHERATNANDEALREDGTVDDALLDAAAGVWFSGRADATTAPDDALGALPYDTYLLEELPCAANEGHLLVSTYVTVSRNAVDLDLGTMDDETIPTPALSTDLTYAAVKAAPAEDGLSLTDSVRYEGLVSGHGYRLVDELHAVGPEGADLGVVASVEQDLLPELSAGSVEVRFEGVDASGLAGKSLVARTYLYDGERLVASHDSLDDDAQTVRVPSIGTTLLSDATASHNAPSYAGSTVTDTAALRNLIVGRTYTVRGTLRLVDVGEDGSPRPGESVAEAESTFEATQRDMEVQLSFEVPGAELAGRTVNAAETLLAGDVVVATHDDAGDEGQSVTLPAVTTLATNAATGTGSSPDTEGQTLVDTVGLSGLIPGERYALRGTVHAKDLAGDGTASDGGALAGADGADATSEVEFVAEQPSMSLEMEIPYDARGLAGRDAVAFEELYDENGVLLARHADVEDARQTLHVPTVSTRAAAESTGTQEVPAEGNQVVTDQVHAGNLVVGETYELVATLHAKGRDEAGNVVDLGELTDADGSAITATRAFTAEEAEEDVELSLTVDAGALAGQEVVFFEELRQGDVTLALHADINDADQTLRVATPEEPGQAAGPGPTSGVPRTGEPASAAAAVCAAGVGLAGTAGLIDLLRRRHRSRRL